MTPEEMRTLYDYNAWANHRQLEAASQLTAEQFVKSMASSFSSVRDTLAHIFGAEWLWLERFQGRSPASLPEASQFPDFTSLRARWLEHESALLDRKSTRLNSSHVAISYAVFCLKKKTEAA